MNSRFETLIPAAAVTKSAIAHKPDPGVASWWANYRSRLDNLSEASKLVLDEASSRIATAALPTLEGGELDVESWGESRVRSGLVVGSVQSGKTASMFGVCAYLLDRRVDIVVVLAGTRVALWMQTLERFLEKLDGSTPTDAWKRSAVRTLIPEPEDILNDLSRLPAKKYLPSRRLAAIKSIKAKRPVILLVPKEDDHLIELSKFLKEICPQNYLEAREKPVSMIVLDDEADDASILDSNENARVTPQYIQNLWSVRDSGEATRHKNLLATYVAYTATPQANFLQRTHNPLAPKHFAIALRVPLDHGTGTTPTFREPAGVRSYYCGGELFYERYRGVPGDFCLATVAPIQLPSESDELFELRFNEQREDILGEALRAYFVGGALRLLFSKKKLSVVSAAAPQNLPTLKALLPAPHSMLFHPSALRDEHFAGAIQIAKWSIAALEIRHLETEEGLPLLSVDGLAERLSAEESRWKRWMTEYSQSSSILGLLPGARYDAVRGSDWDEVKRILIDEVFPHTKLRILNSDPRADDRPHFEPISSGALSDQVVCPPDMYTIFVAGNVLSRGLTVDGLCTSLFLRSSNEPAADTQMQMQRWFGYRGAHLPYCRIFAFDDQLALFRRYHANDEALKTEIIRRPQDSSGWAEALILEGDDFRATSKVDSRKVPLHPGPTPAIRLVENIDPSFAKANLGLVSELVESDTWQLVEEPAGTIRGMIRTEPMEMLDVASLLERFRYHNHEPCFDEELHSRWGQLQTLLGIKDRLFRPPVLEGKGSFVDPAGCPYSIAAYLRLWSEMLSIRTAPGLFPTDAPRLPWASIDLPDYKKTAPTFYLAIRFGEEGPSSDSVLHAAGVKIVRRSTHVVDGPTIKALWGSRGVGGQYYGDQMLDYHFHKSQPVPRMHQEPMWRPRGHPGLLMFYIARTSLGEQPLLGLGIPHGGPDHIAALRLSAQS